MLEKFKSRAFFQDRMRLVVENLTALIVRPGYSLLRSRDLERFLQITLEITY